MKNRLYLVCVVLLFAAVVGLLWWSPWEAPEPVYYGKPLSHWIRASKRDSWIGAAAYRKQVWPSLPGAIQKLLPAPIDHADDRFSAREVLGEMGPMAKPVIPALLRALKEDDASERSWAALALVKIAKGDKRVAAAFTQALKDKDPVTREIATNALLRFDPGTAVKAGVPMATLVRSVCLDQDVRRAVADALALGDGRLSASNVMAALTEALKDENIFVRQAAPGAIIRLDPGAAVETGVVSIAGLIETAYDDLDFRRTVATALLQRDSRVVAAYTAALNDANQSVRYRSGFVLAEIDQHAAAKAGASMLKNRDASIRASAVTVLGQVGKRDMNGIVSLVEALSDEEYDVRSAATNWLRRTDPEAAAKAGVKVPSP
jgi:HEAT repeat protein